MSTKEEKPCPLIIPRVFPNITEKRIRNIFDTLFLVEIERIEMIPTVSKEGKKFNKVLLHLSSWHDNETAEKARTKLLGGDSVKIIYDEPWFWNVSSYRAKAPPLKKEEPEPSRKRTEQRPKPMPTIVLTEENNNKKFQLPPRFPPPVRKYTPNPVRRNIPTRTSAAGGPACDYDSTFEERNEWDNNFTNMLKDCLNVKKKLSFSDEDEDEDEQK